MVKDVKTNGDPQLQCAIKNPVLLFSELIHPGVYRGGLTNSILSFTP
jgi:hypothetical protein